jgi:hypothetical protein
LVEAQDPHGMVPTSTPYIYKVFEIIHMLWLWMGRLVHHHATTTILVAAEFRELADFLGHSKATNDVKVQWLRPQTHMEWFLHPLHTYTRSLRPFICCGRADGSTITPLAPYMYAKNFRELADFLGHSKATNDVKVQ